MQQRLGFVLGKPPRPDTVVADLIESLRIDGFVVTVHLPHESGGSSSTELFALDLVVQRGLRRDALAALVAVEAGGVRCCNRIAATIAVADRLEIDRRLGDAGIGVADTRPVETWEQARDAAAAGPIVVKARDSGIGRSAQVTVALDGSLPSAPVFGGPWVVQRFVPGDGTVQKVYVAGRHQRGLRKPASGTAPAGATRSEPFRPSSALATLAASAGSTLGLDIYNVDVIDGPDGLCVVDVNPFPGFRDVPDAAALVNEHVRTIVGHERPQ